VQLLSGRKRIRLAAVHFRGRRKQIPEVIIGPMLKREAMIDVVPVVQTLSGPNAIQGSSRLLELSGQRADFPGRVLYIGPGKRIAIGTGRGRPVVVFEQLNPAA
jgi:hypothetical protein